MSDDNRLPAPPMETHPANEALAQTLAAFLDRADYGLWAQVPGYPGYFVVEVGGGEEVQIWHGDSKEAHLVGPRQPCEFALEEGIPELVKLCAEHQHNSCPWGFTWVESSD